MILLLDFGNTSLQYAVYEVNSCLDSGKHFGDTKVFLEDIKNQYPQINRLMYSDVRGGQSNVIQDIFPSIPAWSLRTSHLEYPFTNLYKTPETLGADRKALAAAAFFKFPKTHCLIIDAGSCITYDFLDKEGRYHGGAISPGIWMRYEALHRQTGKLPQLTPTPPKDFLGTQTTDAIHAGVYFGVRGEVEYHIEAYRKVYPHLNIILTGGDHQWLSKSIKKPIFAEPNFLLEGMFALSQFNKNS